MSEFSPVFLSQHCVSTDATVDSEQWSVSFSRPLNYGFDENVNIWNIVSRIQINGSGSF